MKLAIFLIRRYTGAMLRDLSLLLVSTAFLSSACDSKEAGKAGTPSVTASAPATAAARSSGSVTGDGSAIAAVSAAPKAAGAGASYTGEYKATIATLSVPEGDAFKGFRYRGDKAEDGVGPGTLLLSVAADGAVTGEGEGSLGKFVLKGMLKDGALTANVTPAKAGEGFIGFLEATEKDAAFAGTMKLASFERGNLIREATFTLKKK
jgi:hypothetical protein